MSFLKKQLFVTPLLLAGTLSLTPPLLASSFEQYSSPKKQTDPNQKNPVMTDSKNMTASALTGSIKVLNRQLIVNGVPFVMKAVCYNPVPKGKDNTGLITTHPSVDDLAVIEKDFQMMHAAGINTIRTYQPLLDQRVLSMLVKYHLRTIVPIFNSYTTTLTEVTHVVSTLKNHPSTLIWELGNEWNYNYLYSKKGPSQEVTTAESEGIGMARSITLLQQVIAYIRERDTTHPISTVIGDLPDDNAFWASLPDGQIDIYGTNIYDGLSFNHPTNNRFERWKKISNKPLYIAEFGSNAFNNNSCEGGSEDDQSQAFATRSLITEIQNNLSANNPDNVLIGASIFEWCDEWWKDPQTSLTVHGNGGFTLPDGGPYPDHTFHEEWWGIVDIDRNPRPAYEALQELYCK